MNLKNEMLLSVFKPLSDEDIRRLIQRPPKQIQIESMVKKIVDDVRKGGDKALLKYTEKFDGVRPETIKVPEEEIDRSADRVTPALKFAIQVAKNNIKLFHERNSVRGYPAIETTAGVVCWQRSYPIECVGLYVPGGSAPLVSTVLMLGIPAIIAGCREIVLCSPPGPDGRIDPAVLYAASFLGIRKIFRAGGAQAIASMAYGTETVPEVFKIFGPGNKYVTMAKMLVSLDRTAIDMPAGPSELMVFADESAVPGFIAADLLSQAEHGPDSQVILFSTSEKILKKTSSEIGKRIGKLKRKAVALESMKNARLIFLKDKKKIAYFINEYAPEHLIVATADPGKDALSIQNVGSVFLGNMTPESAGDYISGTNHTLPTGGWARSVSGLTVESFRKTTSFQAIQPEGLRRIGKNIEVIAEAEGLDAHAASVSVRLQRMSQGDPE